MNAPYLKPFLQFATVGAGGFLLNLAVTFVLTEFAGLWYLLSFIAGTWTNWTWNFLLNSRVTFYGHDRSRYFFQYIRFLGMYSVASIVSMSLVYALTSIMEVYYMLSIIIVSLAVSPFTFLYSRRFIFFRESPATDPSSA